MYSSRGPRAGAIEGAPEKMLSQLEQHKKRRKKIMVISALSALGLFLAAIAGIFVYLKALEGGMNRSLDGNDRLALQLERRPPGEPYNMLIMGFDKRKGETAFRSDTMILTRVNPKTQEVWMVSIPRDYRVEIPGKGTNKANAAYAFGKEALAIQTVERLTGQKINHFVGVTFSGFADVVDAMGGVEIDVPQKINDRKADYTSDKSASVIDAGKQVLDGDHALTFVRSRAYATGDFARMENQQLFFRAVADQAAKNVSIVQLPSLVGAIAPSIATDMSLLDMASLGRDLRAAGASRVYTATLPGTWKSPYVVPDEEGKAEILEKFVAGVPFDEEMPKDSESAMSPENVSVTVRNGTTRSGLAAQAASVLRARGFNVTEVGNTANQSVYDATLIVYKESPEAAESVGKYLPPGIKHVESRGMYSYDSEIMLVIGQDWDVSKLPVVNVNTN